MPVTFYDYFSFPFNGGRGVRTSQLDGLINESQLHPDAGIPNYVINPSRYTYDAANAVLGASLAGVVPAGQPLAHSIIFGFAPLLADLPRSADDMTVAFGTHIQPTTRVRHYTGVPLKARDVTPGQLLEGFYTESGVFTLLEPLRNRPQDYVFAFVIGADGADDITQAELSGSSAVFSTATDNVLGLAAAIAASGISSSSRRYFFIGVPAVAPDIAGTFWNDSEDNVRANPEIGFSLGSGWHHHTPATTISHGGEEYKWFRTRIMNRNIDDWIKIFQGTY